MTSSQPPLRGRRAVQGFLVPASLATEDLPSLVVVLADRRTLGRVAMTEDRAHPSLRQNAASDRSVADPINSVTGVSQVQLPPSRSSSNEAERQVHIGPPFAACRCVAFPLIVAVRAVTCAIYRRTIGDTSQRGWRLVFSGGDFATRQVAVDNSDDADRSLERLSALGWHNTDATDTLDESGADCWCMVPRCATATRLAHNCR